VKSGITLIGSVESVHLFATQAAPSFQTVQSASLLQLVVQSQLLVFGFTSISCKHVQTPTLESHVATPGQCSSMRHGPVTGLVAAVVVKVAVDDGPIVDVDVVGPTVNVDVDVGDVVGDIVVVVAWFDSQVQVVPLQIMSVVQMHIPELTLQTSPLLQSLSVSQMPLEIICRMHSALLQTMSEGQSASSMQASVHSDSDSVPTEHIHVLLTALQTNKP
jgi:hypothetical protein